jgi:hypothetical protein
VNICRSKVDRDVGGRDVVAAVLERRAYAIPTLTDGGIGQTDGMKWSSIVLIPDTSTSTSIMLGIDTVNRGPQRFIEHGA